MWSPSTIATSLVPLEHLLDVLDLLIIESGARVTEDGRHCAEPRSREERPDEVLHRVLSQSLRGDARLVDVPRTCLLMLDVALLLEKPERRPNGRRRGRTRQLGVDFRDGGRAEAPQDLHDLP